jgi:hypothetical protein
MMTISIIDSPHEIRNKKSTFTSSSLRYLWPRLSYALALLVAHRLSPVTSEIREIQIASLELQLAESTMAQRVLVAAAILGTGSGSGAAFASNFLSEEG